MVAALALIASTLGIPFTYGELQAHNVSADHALLFPILYLEGYSEGSFGLDNNGDMMVEYDLILFVFSDSKLSDNPFTRQNQITPLLLLAQRVYRNLSKTHYLSRAVFTSGINITDRNLDGVRLAFRATPINQTPVC